MDERSPPDRRILITGPTGSGKTHRTARYLEDWVDENGPKGVVVLEFAPEHRQKDGVVLGRRIKRFVRIPDGVDYHEVVTRAPRAATVDVDQAIEVARENEEACRYAIEAVRQPVTVIVVNDATMAYHVPGTDPAPLLEKISKAPVAVVNALDPRGFDPDHPVTRQEQEVLARLAQSVDEVMILENKMNQSKLQACEEGQ